jgi:hypothetical protein
MAVAALLAALPDACLNAQLLWRFLGRLLRLVLTRLSLCSGRFLWIAA